jgi:hypothetical protein
VGLIWLAAAGSPRGALAHDMGDPLASACGVQVRADAAPAQVSPGMTVSMRNQLVFSCPQQRRPFHLALVGWRPDGAGSAGAGWVPAAFALLAERMNPEAQGWVAVGAVAYADVAEDLCAPVRAAEAVKACTKQLAGARELGKGGRGLGDAVYQAWKALRLARADKRLRLAEYPPRESLVVVVPPELPARAPGCRWARTAVAQALADGMDVHLVCATEDCNAECVSAAVPPDRFGPRAHWPEVEAQALAQAVASELHVMDVTLHENLTPASRLVPGSTDPVHRDYDEANGTLFWQLTNLRTQALEVSYALWPQGRGEVTLAGQGYLQFYDSTRRSGSTVLPARRVRVVWSAFLPLAVRMQLGVSP